MTTAITSRQKLINEVRVLLGEGMVRIELTPLHYETAVDMALDRYRLRSSNSTDERYLFVELQPDESTYVLPKEVTMIKQLYRRGTTGTASGTGVNFDPFGAAFVNQVSLGLGSGSGSLLTYELFAGFQETVGRMFGLFINYDYNAATHTLTITRHIRAKESLLAHVEVSRSEDELYADPYARPWIRDFTKATCKIMLGEARGKFTNFVGPQGGTSLNADALKAEGQAELDRLEHEVSNQFDQNMGWGFIIG